jgi:hypothetical protein
MFLHLKVQCTETWWKTGTATVETIDEQKFKAFSGGCKSAMSCKVRLCGSGMWTRMGCWLPPRLDLPDVPEDPIIVACNGGEIRQILKCSFQFEGVA